MKIKIQLYSLLFLLVSTVAFGQSISIFDIDTTNFPTMKAKFYAFDKDGNQVRPTKDKLKIIENGTERKILDVRCPMKKPIAISSVLTFDVSGSMSGGNLDLAKTAAKSWIDALPTKESQAAITSFDNNNYIIQDFTRDNSKLLTAIEKLNPNGGTDYNKGFIEPMGGGIIMAKTGKYKRVLIFLTDGRPNFEPDIQKIIHEAKINNITIFAVTLGMNCPQNLKDISLQTDGYWYENVTTLDDAKNIYLEIMRKVQDDPCEIIWESRIFCNNSITNVELEYSSHKSSKTYLIPVNLLASIEINPKLSTFGPKPINTKTEKIITITAKNKNFNILGINRKYGSLDFDIISTTFPILLQKDNKIDIILKFSPKDSSFNYAVFEIATDECSVNFVANGGYPGKIGTAQTLKLSSPNGGEVFVAGSDTLIKWDGITHTDTVSLDYSFDNGLNWKNITKNATGLSYLWKNIPLPISKECLVRVQQMQSSSDSLGKLLFTLYGHNKDVWSVAFHPFGEILASGSFDNTVKLWDIEKKQNIATLVGHSNDVFSISFSPDGATLASGSLDNSVKIWDIDTKQNILTLTFQNPISCVKFSNDGKLLAIGSWDNSIKLLDLATGNIIYTLTGHQGWVLNLAFNYNNELLASSSNDNNIILWDVSTGKKIRNLFGHKYLVNEIVFHPDGSKLISSSGDRTIKLWEVSSGKEIYEVNGQNSEINCINFNPSGTKFASGNLDNNIKIWEFPNFQNIHTLLGHQNAVRSVSFSPDGTILASGSSDNTVKIWKIDNIIFQSDQSDAVFSIVAPSPSSIDIDMKECLVGVSKDSLIAEFVMNKGSYPYRVDSVYFTGADANAFSQVSGFPKFMVDTNSSKTVELRFNPSRIGLHQAKVHIITQTDTLIQNITGVGIQPTIQIVNDLIDFGYIDVGMAKDTLQALTIKNVSTVDIDIKNTYHSGPNDKDFTTIKGGGAFKLLAGETAKLDMRFLPTSVGRTSGTLMFEYGGIGSPAVVQLFGEGIIKNLQIINKTIDFGKIRVGTEKDSLQIVVVKNIGSAPIEITNIFIDGPNIIDFFELSNIKKVILQPNEELKLDLRFKPINIGNKNVNIIFEYDGEGSPSVVQLFGEGVQPIVQVINNTIDFEQVQVGNEKDTIQALTIMNIGNAPLSIFNIYKSGSNTLDFTELNNLKNTTLQPNEELKLDLRFKPSFVGFSKDSIIFEHDGIGSPTSVELIGEGISSGFGGGKASLKLDSIVTETSKIVEYPVKLTLDSKVLKSGANSLNFDITYNNTLLYPLENYPITNKDGFATLSFKNVPLTTDPIQVLQTLRFKTGLGNEIETPLTISNFELIGTTEEIDVTLNDGNLKLTDVCYDGGVRLLNPNSIVSMANISPNPVNSIISIDLNLIEIGNTEVSIYNLLGEKVKTIFNKDISETGSISINSELSDLSNGQYVVVFTTPTYSERQNILILK